MPQMTLQQAIEQGLKHHAAGQYRLAHELYAQVLAFDPNNVDAQHLLGVLAHQTGRSDEAVDMIQKAIALNPDVAVIHYNLSEALRAVRRYPEAASALRRAIELEPQYLDAHNNLAMVLNELGDHDQAAAAARRAIDLDPKAASPYNNLANALRATDKIEDAIEAALEALELRPEFPEALNNLGICYARQRRFAEAVLSYRRAIKIKPDFAEAYNNLGAALLRAGKHDTAVEALEQAIRIRPGYSDAYNNLGGALRESGRIDQGILCFEKALGLRPDFPEGLNNLGLALSQLGRQEEAVKHIRRAIELKPDFAGAYFHLGLVYKDQSQIALAEREFAKALELEPDHVGASASLGIIRMEQGLHVEGRKLMLFALEKEKDWQLHSNYCLLSNYDPSLNGEAVLDIHRQWERDYGRPNKLAGPHENDRSPDRPLRIGYVSPDFRVHAVSHFIEPLLRGHDQQQFQTICYSHVARPDSVTHLLQSLATGWREIHGKSDDDVERMIRSDKIDILVDLAGHTARNRLTLFARRPAPVQVSMIGYPCTTGLSAIDYKISDPWVDPPEADRFYTEKLWRLPGSFWCFRPLDDREPIGELPARKNGGRITFGSVNNFAKISDAVLDLWAQIVAAVADSTIAFQSAALTSDIVRQRVYSAFAKRGVGADRIKLTTWSGFADYVDLIRATDIALDPFPFNGGTTTCHLLFYGVPVVTLAGERQVSRMGVSMMHAIGLDDWVARSPQQYVELAVAKASDLDGLATTHSAIRSRLLASPLCNSANYAREVETAYRQMWQQWCGGGHI